MPVIDCSEQPDVDSESASGGSAVSADDLQFLSRFETCTLGEQEWTHEAHIHVAWIALSLDSGAAAENRIRRGIKRFNAEVLGRPEQYHETVTLAFAAIIRTRLRPGEPYSLFLDRCQDILSSDRPILLTYYSAEKLALPEARETFIAPDRQALPTVTAAGQAQ